MEEEIPKILDALVDYTNLLILQVLKASLVGLILGTLIEVNTIRRYIKEKSYKDLKNISQLKPLFIRYGYVLAGLAVAFCSVLIANFILNQFSLLNQASIDTTDTFPYTIIGIIPLVSITLYNIAGYFLVLTAGIKMFVITSKVLFIISTLLLVISAILMNILGAIQF